MTNLMLDTSLWMIEPKAFRALLARLKTSATPAAIEAAQAAALAYADRPTVRLVGDVAVIDMCGPITYRRSWFSMYFGGATIEDMQAQFQMALADPAVKTIVFRCDSPGGSVEMVPEFADVIFAARGQKPIVAVADTQSCSASYWIASQADVVYVTGSSFVGSVGCYLMHEDVSAMLEKIGIKVTFITHGDHKVDGNEFEPLSDAARASFQTYADDIGADFEAAVARGRGVTKKVVAETFGQGAAIRGKQAVALGMADKLATFTQALGKASKGRGGAARAAALPEGPIIAAKSKAEDDEDGIPPVDGQCPDGYELGEDGMCYLAPPDPDDAEAKARAAAERDEAAILAALI